MERPFVTVDGNEAAANVAYQTAEVVAIYPITPASAMGIVKKPTPAANNRNTASGTKMSPTASVAPIIMGWGSPAYTCTLAQAPICHT